MYRHVLLFAAALSLVACLAHSACAEDSVFEVPRLDGIRIDGQTDDWAAQGFRVEIMKDESGRYLPAGDFDAGFRLGWDDNGLLVLARSRDDMFVESPSEAELWRLDGIEMFMATRKGGPDMVQPCVTPGMDPQYPALRWYIHDYRQDPDLTKEPATIEAASARTSDGYVIEACLPWKNLGLAPKVGDEIAFQIYINDADGPEKKIAVKWFPLGETHANTKHMHRVILSTNASAPVVAAASAEYEKMERMKIAVLGADELAGRDVAAQSAGATLATGVFKAAEGRSEADFTLPMPPRGEHHDRLELVSGGRVIATVELPDPKEIASKALIWMDCKLFPFSFVGERFPGADFEKRSDAEKLIGAYENSVQFVDADGHSVTSAVKAGRYGAILTVRPVAGRPLVRFLTAYRFPDSMRDFKPWKYDPHLSVTFPGELELDPAVVERHSNDMNRMVVEVLMETLRDNHRGSILLAGLHDAQSRADSQLSQETTGFIERQWWVDFKRKHYGMAEKYPEPFVAPTPIAGKPAPALRDGTCLEAGVAKDAADRIDALLTSWAADTDEAFSVCLAKRGVVFFHKAYGTRDGKPMTVNTPSWMASITKLMSGTLMMMLVDQGKVGLDDPIADYLPPFRGVETSAPITVRHLYTHATGLDGHWGDYMNDLEERVAYYAPYLPVGEQFVYNGAGFAVGGKIIETVSGECIPLFYKHHLLGPLGMTNTEVSGTSGDASSTPLDMAKLGQMLLNRGAYGDMRFMSEETFAAMLPEKLTKTLGPTATKMYGIGTDVMGTDTLGEGTFGHGAASAATFLVSPSRDLVVVMCRDSAGKNFSKYHPDFLRTVAEVTRE